MIYSKYFFRTGLYYGYRICRGGKKILEDSCLESEKSFLGKSKYFFCEYTLMNYVLSVVGRKTAFDLDYMFATSLKIYHHNSTFESLASEFNDFHCDGIYCQY